MKFLLQLLHTAFVAAGGASVRLRSSRNLISIFDHDRGVSFYDCCAAGRRLRQLLQELRCMDYSGVPSKT